MRTEREHRDRLGSHGQGRSYCSSFCVFYPSNFVLLNLTFPKHITWGMLKKKGGGTPRVVSGRRRPHASYAPVQSIPQDIEFLHDTRDNPAPSRHNTVDDHPCQSQHRRWWRLYSTRNVVGGTLPQGRNIKNGLCSAIPRKFQPGGVRRQHFSNLEGADSYSLRFLTRLSPSHVS